MGSINVACNAFSTIGIGLCTHVLSNVTEYREPSHDIQYSAVENLEKQEINGDKNVT